jgi:hypothetical protein
MIGAVRGIDPETGHPTTTRDAYIDAAPGLSDAARNLIFEGNARRVFPRLDSRAEGAGPLKRGASMHELGIVHRSVARADRAATERLAPFGVATVHEAIGRVGLMHPGMRPIYAGAQLSGTAVTVLLQPGDNWMLHVAAEQIQPGDVVVAAVTSPCSDGYFGDLLATSSRLAGRGR